jgi:fructose-1,6-bisphosphatase/inositol monophosphatase family enzyme
MRPEVRWPFDPSAVGALVDDAARLHMEARAGRGFRLVSDGPSGPVTTVDLEVQRCLEAELASLAERVRFVGEESEEPWTEVLASNDPDRLCWVLDPLDGTASFLRGENSFGVQLALLRGATVIGAWINCAALGLSAAAWDGAPLVRTGPWPTPRPIPTILADVEAVIAAGDFAPDHRCRTDQLAAELAGSRGTASCAVDYLELVGGAADVLVYRRSLPWDHAPGVYLAQRAGASVERFDGQPYRIHDVAAGIFAARSPEVAVHRDWFVPRQDGHGGQGGGR